MFDLEDYAKKYSDLYRDDDFETVLVKIRRKQVMASLRKHNHQNILEIGCGLEPLFPYCDHYETYTIVEPAEEFVQHAKALSSGEDKIRVVQGYFEEAYKQLLGKSYFDFVICSALLHQVPNPATLLQSIYQLCSDSTVVHINTPNGFSFHIVLALEMGIIDDIFVKSETDIELQRHTRFDKASLFRLVEGNGFQILASGTYFIKPFTNEQMGKILKTEIVDISIIDGLERMIKYLPDMGSEIFVDVKRK